MSAKNVGIFVGSQNFKESPSKKKKNIYERNRK